jgi:hypothetical protein
VEDRYPDKYAKMALAITSTQLAKQNVVDEFGIGEDLPFMVLGWRADRLAVMVGFSREDMRRPVDERLPNVALACGALRSLHWCDSITFVAEGYMSKAPFLLEGQELAEAFANHDMKKVSECLTSSHVWINQKHRPQAMLMSTPYQYLLGRHIVWDDNSAYSNGIGHVFRDAPILSVIAEALMGEVSHVTQDEFEEAWFVLLNQGMSIQDFLEPPSVI